MKLKQIGTKTKSTYPSKGKQRLPLQLNNHDYKFMRNSASKLSQHPLICLFSDLNQFCGLVAVTYQTLEHINALRTLPWVMTYCRFIFLLNQK